MLDRRDNLPNTKGKRRAKGGKAKATKAAKPDDYLAAASEWDYEVHHSLRRKLKLSWMVTAGSLAITGLSVLALVAVLPLKEFQPYVVEVERATGDVRVLNRMLPGDLTQEEAITQANLYQYVLYRETYDQADQEKRFNWLIRNSEGQALDDYRYVFSAQNPDNPTRMYRDRATIETKIKGVSFIQRGNKKDTASVRFYTTLREKGKETVTHWNATIQFRYTNEPQNMQDRFLNPLGFQVVHYRLDQEVIES